MPLRQNLEEVLSHYRQARSESFGSDHSMWQRFEELGDDFRKTKPVQSRERLEVQWSTGVGNWAKVPWIAFLDERETDTTRHGVYCVHLFREDMSGVYLTFNQGVTELKQRHGTREARRILQQRAERLRPVCADLRDLGFRLDNEIDLRASGGLGREYERSTIAYKFYPSGSILEDRDLEQDLETVLSIYDEYLADEKYRADPIMPEKLPARTATEPPQDFDLADAIHALIAYIDARGFVFQPWHIAEYVTAIRTKPFAILAGVSGTGKSKLPVLVAEGTGSAFRLVPVRPDWTDSADVLGYVDLEGVFRPGAVLEVLHSAMEQEDQFWVCIVDEMNLARVEQYFAEVLSRIEDRRPTSSGGYTSPPLVQQLPREEDAEWTEIVLPSNLALVGTVNMDETTHGFSRKVLDRAFTIELSDIELERWKEQRGNEPIPQTWPISAWQPRAIMLSELNDPTTEEEAEIDRVIGELHQVNGFLKQAQLQVGYRSRDEIALFVLHAREMRSAFVTRAQDPVDSLDLALHMKILPRIVGGSGAVRRALLQLLGWAHTRQPIDTEAEAIPLLESWADAGRPGAVADAEYPRTAARLCLMWERMQSEGYTSFWL